MLKEAFFAVAASREPKMDRVRPANVLYICFGNFELGYLFIIQTKKLFFRLLFCTLVHMVYIASYALHRSKRSGLVKCHSRRRVCIVCGGKWVEWDVTSGGYEKITRAEYWQITAE